MSKTNFVAMVAAGGTGFSLRAFRGGKAASTVHKQEVFSFITAIFFQKFSYRRILLRFLVATVFTAVLTCPAIAQQRKPISPAQVVQEVRDYRTDHEDRIVRELAEFLSIPNVASDTPNIQKNAAHLVEMLEARGIETHLLPIAGRGPVVFGKKTVPEATRTVIFYAHYDGQPVDPAAWTDGTPFEPVLRSDAIEAGGKRIPFPENSARQPAVYKDDWRIYARSSSDDKSPIVALLAALDALRAKQIPLKVNLKLILEGEEEAGSPNLQRTLELHKNLLGGDLLITGDGPVHQSGRPLVFFGNRGILGFEITTYGPIRSLHSGHYGNWAPNPAFQLARLLASMKNEEGHVLIEGFYDDVAPLGELEKKTLEAMPNNDVELARELQFAKPEGEGKRLVELIQLPSLNIRGIRSAYVGEQAQNIVPDEAQAALDVRLVKGENPDKKFEQIVGFIRKQGFYVTTDVPTKEERLAHPNVVRVLKDVWSYPASRTPMDLPASKALVKVVQDATAGDTVIAPTLGGSVPMYIFEDLGLPWIGVPIVNYDNHQHSSDENLRLGHLWRGIELYAAILADLNW
jgi:acetylornithine deacetylase/succinyl-diaminopimelate desuccinylase-like protein